MQNENNQAQPTEYVGLVQQQRIDSLEDHLKHCYSSERYEEFQTGVETIVERYLDTDKAHEKLKGKINRQIKDYMDERGLRNKTFWIPTSIALIAAVASIFVK
ncbi:MAG TPA: hypothetical protein VLH38_03305 [Patescibacteria group bacterium]|nr:hypothetical protein [Patescibacteria group bacterium]